MTAAESIPETVIVFDTISVSNGMPVCAIKVKEFGVVPASAEIGAATAIKRITSRNNNERHAFLTNPSG
jgi:hypothetical protein